ncbi:MAG: hypothetical protein LBR34_00070 [Prevotella sp.]|jgi:hypothetical protein|nr:hypothetical protein [Prevotella sp.]
MKKLFSSIFLVGLVAVLFVSCEKDDDKVNAPDSLAGTAWLFEDKTETDENGVEIGVAVELDFVSASKVDINILVGGVKADSFAVSGFPVGTLDYTYSKPNVTIIDEDGDTLTGKVDGDKLTIDGDVFNKEK